MHSHYDSYSAFDPNTIFISGFRSIFGPDSDSNSIRIIIPDSHSDSESIRITIPDSDSDSECSECSESDSDSDSECSESDGGSDFDLDDARSDCNIESGSGSYSNYRTDSGSDYSTDYTADTGSGSASTSDFNFRRNFVSGSNPNTIFISRSNSV